MEDSKLILKDEVYQLVGCAMEVLNGIGHGFHEKIYENALAHRLRKKGFRVKQQDRLKVFDEDGTVLGLLKTDLFVDNRQICEIKGCSSLVDEHVAQLLGYLPASRFEHGLLINFGAPRLQIKKYILT